MADAKRASGRIVRGTAVAFVVAALTLGTAPAAQAGTVVPPEVQQVFDERALPYVHERARFGGTAASVYAEADRISNITAIHEFSPQFLRGADAGRAYVGTGRWIASVLAGYTPVGTITVAWEPPSEQPQIVNFDGDSELGGLLRETLGTDYVVDPGGDATFVVSGDTIGPLNANAWAELPAPTTLEDYQPILAARFAERDTAAPRFEWGLVAGAAVITAGIGVLVARRPR